jgi:deoxyribodipyrimidine photo-lyase
MSAVFPATRAAALARWQQFSATAPDYGARRNHVVPGHGNVSRLSAAIRHRLVLGEELRATLLAAHPFERVEKLVQELQWRAYWRAWLALRPGVWQAWVQELGPTRDALDRRTCQRLAEVEAGASGVSVMDAFVRELVATGYLHNHARMWFASYWVHVERLPWQLGAAFFLRHLIDGDAASNTLSWRWVAGLHTAGKRYLVRRSNIEKYLDASYREDQTGLEQLDDAVIASLEAALPLPRVEHPPPLESERWPSACAANLPAGQRWGLWVHDEDCCVELSPLASLAPTILIVTGDAVSAQRFGYAAARLAYTQAALQDATERARRHFGAALPCISDCGAIGLPWQDILATAAREHGLQGIVGLRPAVGSLADQLPDAQARLAANGVALQLITRDSDCATLRDARGGFFGYWSRVAATLR